MNDTLTAASLSELLVQELAKALALPNNITARQFIRRLFGKAAPRFSDLGLELDRIVAEGGLSAFAPAASDVVGRMRPVRKGHLREAHLWRQPPTHPERGWRSSAPNATTASCVGDMSV